MLNNFFDQFDGGVSVNVNGAGGSVVTDPATGQLVVDVNTTGAPVYGQRVQPGAIASATIAGIPVLTIVIGLFLLALFGLVRGRR